MSATLCCATTTRLHILNVLEIGTEYVQVEGKVNYFLRSGASCYFQAPPDGFGEGFSEGGSEGIVWQLGCLITVTQKPAPCREAPSRLCGRGVGQRHGFGLVWVVFF